MRVPSRLGPTVLRRDDDELGTLRYCRGCDEWWPEDDDFFGTTLDRAGRPHTWCRACKAARSRAYEPMRAARRRGRAA